MRRAVYVAEMIGSTSSWVWGWPRPSRSLRSADCHILCDMAEGDLNEMRRVSASIQAGALVESTI